MCYMTGNPYNLMKINLLNACHLSWHRAYISYTMYVLTYTIYKFDVWVCRLMRANEMLLSCITITEFSKYRIRDIYEVCMLNRKENYMNWEAVWEWIWCVWEWKQLRPIPKIISKNVRNEKIKIRSFFQPLSWICAKKHTV